MHIIPYSTSDVTPMERIQWFIGTTNIERRTPAPIYIALKVHVETRKKDLVDKMHSMGLSISYDRLLGISAEVANTVCAKYEAEGVVCAPNLVKNIFTTGAVDNLDHNPSSTTSSSSFHGTAISIMQHPAPEDDIRHARPVIDAKSQGKRSIPQLPASYATVHPAALFNKNPVVPPVFGPVRPDIRDTPTAVDEEHEWLEHVNNNMEMEDLVITKDSNLSWAAFHADKQGVSHTQSTITALLPLFLEKAATVAMIKHSMDVVKATVQHLNPGQTPVLTMDQPLFSIAKHIQWNFQDFYGEDKFIIVLGGLHIEMAAFKIVGQWLRGSGWTHIISKIATLGTADSFTNACHLTKSRHAHQVTAATLYILQKKAYQKYRLSLPPEEDALEYSEWCIKMCSDQPLFLYWSRTMELQLTILKVVKSLREGHFDQYIISLTQLMPWIFALDHFNYAQWLSVHIRDMCSLSETHPDIFEAFSAGAFTANKTTQPFSRIALDQAHEQVNASVKGDGGAVGLTENPNALRRWMVAGPEMARMVSEYEETTGLDEHNEYDRHHEQVRSIQEAYAKEVLALIEVFEELGNPFEEDCGELYNLETKDVMDKATVESVKDVIKIGTEQYDTFVKERFVDCTKPITDKIKKNQLNLLDTVSAKQTSKHKAQVTALKSDCDLFSRLFIACQTRDGKLEEFFKYENQPWPPSLAEDGKLRGGTKADLLKCLEDLPEELPNAIPDVNAKVMDGAALVHMLVPVAGTTFKMYAQNKFAEYITKELECVDRLDIVWDVYKENNLKMGARAKRGSGVCRKVVPSGKVPSNWKSFLRVDENKSELFHFLAKYLMENNTTGKILCNTFDESVLVSPCSIENRQDLEPCSHEEADTRMLLHVKNAVQCGHQKVTIRTVDTDVVVLAISTFNEVQATELWIAFGTYILVIQI